MTRQQVILISDLHISANLNPNELPWVEQFGAFLKDISLSEQLVFVLGDIVDQGGKYGLNAFKNADIVFSRIESMIPGIKDRIYFIPGNHDYCDRTLDLFNEFCQKHQGSYSRFNFDNRNTYNICFGNFNFICTDSVKDGDYSISGIVDTDELKNHIITNCENILLLHHGIFTDLFGEHDGVCNKNKVDETIKDVGIKHVFHGHAHKTFINEKEENRSYKQYGIGPIGLSSEEMCWIENETNQFFEIIIEGKKIESIRNFFRRGGQGKFINQLLEKNNSRKYVDDSDILPIEYKKPEQYIERSVIVNDEEDYFDFKRNNLYKSCLDNRKVILLADAGIGKTTELKHLAYEVSKKSYKRPVLLPLDLYSGQDILDFVFELAEEYKGIDPETLFLIMDGYDEIYGQSLFNRKMELFLKQNPDTDVCLSMRSGYFLTSPNYLKKFAVCRLKDLSKEEIDEYLEQHNINIYSFRNEAYNRNLHNLLPNPFYLSKLVDMYEKNNNLPSQTLIMGYIIQEQFNQDDEKFKYKNGYSINKIEHEIKQALGKFAFALQLLEITNCDIKEFQNLLNKEERGYLENTGVILEDKHGYRFTHNLFREYFVSRELIKLSDERIKDFVLTSNKKSIDKRWINILGFVLQDRITDNIVNELLEIEPLSLVNIETDKIDDRLRYKLLEKQIQIIEKDNIWFDYNKCSEKQLALFCQSKESLLLLMEHIEKPVNFRSLNFCLMVLSGFSDLYGMEDEVRNMLWECCKSLEVRCYEKKEAISCLAELKLDTHELTKELVSNPYNITPFEALGIYKYLLMTKRADEEIDFIIWGLDKYKNRFCNDNEDRGVEREALFDCLHSIENKESLIKVIEWLADENNFNSLPADEHQHRNNVFNKAVRLFKNGEQSLYDIMYSLFIKSIRHYNDNQMKTAINFFVETGTISKAFETLCGEEENCDFLYAIEHAFNEYPQLVDLLCKIYKEGKLRDNESFEKYITGYNRSDIVFKKCSRAVKESANKQLFRQPAPFDYSEAHKKDIKVFFDSLFDIEKMRELLGTLIALYKGNITYKQLKNKRIELKECPPGVYELRNTIIGTELHNINDKVSGYLEQVNWEYFSLNRICHYLRSNTPETLKVTKEQTAYVKEEFVKLRKQIDFHTAVKEVEHNPFTMEYPWIFYMLLKKAFNFDVDEDYYLGLIEVPYFYINDYNNIEQKYDYIEKNVDIEKIKKKITSLIENEERISFLQDMLYACTRYKIKGQKDSAIRLCNSKELKGYDRKCAIEYIYNVYGSELLYTELMNNSDDELFNVIADVLVEEKDKRLETEMISRFNKIR